MQLTFLMPVVMILFINVIMYVAFMKDAFEFKNEMTKLKENCLKNEATNLMDVNSTTTNTTEFKLIAMITSLQKDCNALKKDMTKKLEKEKKEEENILKMFWVLMGLVSLSIIIIIILRRRLENDLDRKIRKTDAPVYIIPF